MVSSTVLTCCIDRLRASRGHNVEDTSENWVLLFFLVGICMQYYLRSGELWLDSQ